MANLRLLVVVLVAGMFTPALQPHQQPTQRASGTQARREVAITFDDLPGVHMPGGQCDYRALEQLNRKLIKSITAQRIPTLGLVVENNLCADSKERLADLLELWLAAGLELGNHSFSHFDLNNTPLATYEADVVRGEATTQMLLQKRGQRIKYFRHPFLHAGKDLETKQAFEKFLAQRGYQIAPVTIDNQEWVFAAVYARAQQRGDQALMRRVGTAYIAYMDDIFEFFEGLSREVVGYEVRQVLLLHDNLLNADYLEELLRMMKRRGYEFVSIERALQDPAYRSSDTYAGPQGLSWIHRWAVSRGMKLKQEPREPQWISKLFEAGARP